MDSLRPHTKIKRKQTSFRNVTNTLETTHQKSQNAVPSVRDNSRALSVESAEYSHPREDTRGNGQSHKQVEGNDASPTTGEVCSLTDQQPSAYLSLQHYSDYVVMVQSPRTSSPIPDRSPTLDKLQTNVSKNMKPEQGCRKVGKDADHENRKVAGRPGSKEVVGRNCGGSQLQKTMGRLKRYFGLAAACGTTSESRQDDVSYASDEAGCRPPAQAEREESDAVDVDKLPAAKRRTHSHSNSLDTAADVRHSLRPDSRGIGRIHHQSKKYQVSLRDELKSEHRRDPVPSLMARKSLHGEKALATVVPGVRVRVPPQRQLSHHERLVTDSNHIGGTTQTGSWLDDAHARSRENVERWLCQSREADTGRLYSMISRQQHHRHSVQRASHVHNALPSRSRVAETLGLSRIERSASETDLHRPAAANHFRSRDQHRMTSDSSPVPGTPNMAGSTGAEGESHLGPSLVQLVAEIIEGLEHRSRDDSSAMWSGIRGTGTPASKIFQQLTSRVRNTELVARSPIATEDMAGGQENAATARDNLNPRDIACDDNRNEALSEKTLTEKRENLEEATATESGEQKSTGTVPSCSVAVLRQRLLRAVEGNNDRRTVTERPLQCRGVEGRNIDTTPRKSSALINCSTGRRPTHILYFIMILYILCKSLTNAKFSTVAYDDRIVSRGMLQKAW